MISKLAKHFKISFVQFNYYYYYRNKQICHLNCFVLSFVTLYTYLILLQLLNIIHIVLKQYSKPQQGSLSNLSFFVFELADIVSAWPVGVHEPDEFDSVLLIVERA